MESIHKRIRRLRLAKDLTLEKFAELVGVKWQSAQQWEKEDDEGGTAPSRKRHPRVAEVLGVSEEVLVMGEAKPGTMKQLAQDAKAQLFKDMFEQFMQLKDEYQHRIEAEVNFLHSLQYPNKTNSNPHAKRNTAPKRRKVAA